jgi:hypothetical protein
MTRIILEDFELDIDNELSNQITYAIDDLNNLDSKSTAFSKTIILPGTTKNNDLLGNIFDFNNSNNTIDTLPNVKYNFNASKTAKCRIEVNGLQVIKGVFRLLEIVYNGSQIEYECAVFGELGGFVSKLGNSRIEDLDFSAYNHTYNITNIAASWANANAGAGYYYPLIDIGLVSTLKKDYEYLAFRPALFVREYIDKIITGSGYTWQSDFFNTDFFKRQVIPLNTKSLTKLGTAVASATPAITTYNSTIAPLQYSFDNFSGTDWTLVAGVGVTYGGATATIINPSVRIEGILTTTEPGGNNGLYMEVWLNGVAIPGSRVDYPGFTGSIPFIYEYNAVGQVVNPSDYFNVVFASVDEPFDTVEVTGGSLVFNSQKPVLINVNLGDTLVVSDTIPKNIFQKDFFTSILKMFYLMVTEDKFIDKHLIIEPFVNFFNTTPSSYQDWSMKLDRMAQIRTKPMSEVNARYYGLKYKPDSDFYNDGYKKKYNEGYGDFIYDNNLDFAKETETVEVIFAGTPLVGYVGEDKVVSTTFKKSGTTEEKMDHVIRILQAKKISGVASWSIMNSGATLGTYTDYPYAGHLNDPDAPDADINFGATKELFFTLVSGNLSNNLFNTYYSPYMAEITDKDSRLLTGQFKLAEQDIFDLDFSRFVYLDGGLYRISKIIDYTAGTNATTKVELLRVIYTTY